MNRQQAVGMRFHRLVVKGWRKGKNGSTVMLCDCDCGKAVDVIYGNLVKKVNPTQSCGCWRAERGSLTKRHGMSFTKTHRIWSGMKTRCYNPKAESYPDYGGRGIKVCEGWHFFENFLADMGECPHGHSIERLNVNGDYDPDNCKWLPLPEQQNNRRDTIHITLDGETKTLKEWSLIKGVSQMLVHSRRAEGWPDDRLFIPKQGYPRPPKYLCQLGLHSS